MKYLLKHNKFEDCYVVNQMGVFRIEPMYLSKKFAQFRTYKKAVIFIRTYKLNCTPVAITDDLLQEMTFMQLRNAY